jgi:tRNA-specific 2-thiouridylase
VAAARAAEAGHDVTAVHMALMRNRAQTRQGSRGCCSIEDASDARRSAAKLGLDFYVWDLSEEFEDLVVRDFLETYSSGQTPNPCVRCNQFIKFEVLAERALALGFDAVATGHYARVTPLGGCWTTPSACVDAAKAEPPPADAQEIGTVGETRGLLGDSLLAQGQGVDLRRGLEPAKDQSYVLAAVGPRGLSRCLFPLGGATSKDEVRREAERRGLPVSAKPDSYDICFVADGDTRGFLRSRLGERPGAIVDQTGAEVGTHLGAYGFTVGQRRGLRLGRPAADGQPRYVTAIDTASNVVRVGPAASLAVERFAVRELVWFAPESRRAAGQATGLSCQVQVRAHGRALPASVNLAPLEPTAGTGERAEVFLAEPLRGLAAGQSAVLYDGDRVLAHGLIAGPSDWPGDGGRHG